MRNLKDYCKVTLVKADRNVNSTGCKIYEDRIFDIDDAALRECGLFSAQCCQVSFIIQSYESFGRKEKLK